ncbi:MAG: type II toxin-antitoxin system Phd/YefM family antitoxin [Acidobacteria bacterium]|nr:type II toxin-antitoxin system Phd/YefM family antitoxin [Acidobacteriota bacterium]
MPFVTMRDLQRNAAQVVHDATDTGKPAIVTRNGKPVAILIAVDEETFEDFLLARLPSLDDDITAAYKDVDQGLTEKADSVFDTIRASG